MGLAERIREVMGDMAPGEFARACDVSAASVTFWLNGDTKSLKAEPVAHMEAKFGYRASWIVFGKGAKKIEDHAPESRFSEDLQRKVLALREPEVFTLEGIMRFHLGLPQVAQGDRGLSDKETRIVKRVLSESRNPVSRTKELGKARKPTPR